MLLVVYACDKHKVDDILDTMQLGPGNCLDSTSVSQNTFCTLALSDYMKPNPSKSYIILNKNVVRDALYWAPRWNSVYTSDKHRYYYDVNKSVKSNLNKWIDVYKDSIDIYNSDFTYNEIGIPQNEIVFTKPIDLNLYGEWVIF